MTTTEPRFALEALAAAFGSADHVTTLTARVGRRPHLTVASRHARLSEDIYADGTFFRWSWGEPVCPVSDPAAAARKIAHVLRTVPKPAHG